MKPNISYTVWFSQRTGSTLLCQALAATGSAGRPGEFLASSSWPEFERPFRARALQEHLWDLGCTPNGVWGLKFSFYEPHFSALLDVLRRIPGTPPSGSRAAVWEHAFPNHRHIFMTRRNKVRLAVSWWKAIQTNEWHRLHGATAPPVDLAEAYSYAAIDHLYCESVMREAGIQEFFSEAGRVPLTVVYEDFIQDYTGTLRVVLEALELDPALTPIAPPAYAQLADSVSEEWVARFREERQRGWENRGW